MLLFIFNIKEQQAGMLCFQEFWDKRAPYAEYSTLTDLKEMEYQYSYTVKTTFQRTSFGNGHTRK